MSRQIFPPASPDPFRSAIEDVNAALAHQPEIAARVTGLLLDAAQAQAEHTAMSAEWLAGMRYTTLLVNRLLAEQEPRPAAQEPAPDLARPAGRASVIPFSMGVRHA